MTERTIKLQIITSPLPASVRGLTANQKGSDVFTIAINDQKNDDEQAIAFLHEMLHIWHSDHDREGVNISELEHERHRELKRLLTISNANNIE